MAKMSLDKAKALELVGGLLLLVSFAIQNFLYDRWDEEAASTNQAILERAVIDKSILLNETLFFVAEADSSLSPEDALELKTLKLKEAARKAMMAEFVGIRSAGIDEVEARRLLEPGSKAARQIEDLRSYLEFVTVMNTVNQSHEPAALALRRLERSRRVARWLFLVSYVLGSLALLWGLAQPE